MAVFLWDEFENHVTIQSISTSIVEPGSSADCRGTKCRLTSLLSNLHSLSPHSPYQLVYVGESGCDKGTGFR
ncbi:hypothetical protein I7I53_10568 [Histoplasma capsulatum var. duboisii H88]|uniref:Uncharacterized protein n=1 Tax=Ajellomyces capsulatus (strain H88) TaxID=544711 RepID=A0A8A1LDC8_AJEC8|nr:hypothetical protein I7I53_10568 [Histoplasma capsulatum var. duboisii H88]